MVFSYEYYKNSKQLLDSSSAWNQCLNWTVWTMSSKHHMYSLSLKAFNYWEQFHFDFGEIVHYLHKTAISKSGFPLKPFLFECSKWNSMAFYSGVLLSNRWRRKLFRYFHTKVILNTFSSRQYPVLLYSRLPNRYSSLLLQ